MKQYNGEKAIISLTSWKPRIHLVSKTIFSLIRRHDVHVVLVLSKDEFPNKEKDLPDNLLLFENHIEIMWVDGNIKSHKKYFYTFQKYANAGVPIILADDDIIYKPDFADNLLSAHKSHANCIIASRAHYIKFDNNQNILPYRQWEYETKRNTGKFLFFTSGHGTLFPPNIIPKMIPEMNDIFECIYADDILLNAIAYKNKISMFNINKFVDSINTPELLKSALSLKNTRGENRNDTYIKKLNLKALLI